ncbi:uncharacterized protein LOC111128881 isoform X2 [Crassostrea virginica]
MDIAYQLFSLLLLATVASVCCTFVPVVTEEIYFATSWAYNYDPSKKCRPIRIMPRFNNSISSICTHNTIFPWIIYYHQDCCLNIYLHPYYQFKILQKLPTSMKKKILSLCPK